MKEAAVASHINTTRATKKTFEMKEAAVASHKLNWCIELPVVLS
jgi:hypothetical protein